MQIPTPTEHDKVAFRALVPGDPRVEVRPMFGNLGAFVNGNMFLGLFGAQVGVRLPAAEAAALLALDGTGPFGPVQRPMGGYVALPAGMHERDAAAWVDRALEHVSALPPKATKKG